MFSKSLTKHFKGFGSGFTRLHAKLDADTLFDFAIHLTQNETRSRKGTRVKTMHVHSAMSRGRLIQQAFESVTLASPLIFFHRGGYNNNSPRNFRYHLIFGETTVHEESRSKSTLGNSCYLSVKNLPPHHLLNNITFKMIYRKL
jgi:hypothetical protein